MAFPHSFLDELRARLSLSSIVGRVVKLVRNGREYKACCPFHSEKTPSFTLSDEKGFYHCFGCGAHGDVITFVMNQQNLTFPEAVERLAGEAGLEVPRSTPEQRETAQKRAGVLEALEAACLFYHDQLYGPAGAAGLAYLRRRGLRDETIRRFRLGWSPGGGALRAALHRQAMEAPLLLEAGLLKRREDGSTYDFFRERVMFPITDRRGRVIAFGGRILDDGQPKYLNSPDTPVFSKGTVLYGLAQAREAAGRCGEIIAVEGYMDTIALAQGGFPQAVAPLGTALTESQIEELWKLADEPILCFDGDAAGQRAAARAVERAVPLLRPGRSLRFAVMQGAKDPDELIQSHGPAAMRKILDQATPLFEMVWALTRRTATGGERVLDTPERRAAFERDLYGLCGRIQDASVQHHYRQQVKDRLWETFRPARSAGRLEAHSGARSGVPSGVPSGGRSGGRTAGRPPGQWVKGRFVPERPSLGTVGVGQGMTSPDRIRRVHQRVLVTVLLTHPLLADRIGERMGEVVLDEPWLDQLRQRVLVVLGEKPTLDFSALCDHLRAQGFSEPLNFLLTSGVFSHAGFARPESDDPRALKGWEEIYKLSQRVELENDVAQARRLLEQRQTPESYEALLAVGRQRRIDESDE